MTLRERLQRFIRGRWEAGNSDAELLAVEGLKYLKSLEGPPDRIRVRLPVADYWSGKSGTIDFLWVAGCII